jgi:hypothetical protein
MIMASASEVLPTRSITVASSAFMSVQDLQGERNAGRRRVVGQGSRGSGSVPASPID